MNASCYAYNIVCDFYIILVQLWQRRIKIGPKKQKFIVATFLKKSTYNANFYQQVKKYKVKANIQYYFTMG